MYVCCKQRSDQEAGEQARAQELRELYMATVTAEKRSCLSFVGHPSVSGDLRGELKGITQTHPGTN